MEEGMGEDRLKEYKELFKTHEGALEIYWIDADTEITAKQVIGWFITALEQARAEVERLGKENDGMVRRIENYRTDVIGRLEKAELRIQELEAQQKSEREAIDKFVEKVDTRDRELEARQQKEKL